MRRVFSLAVLLLATALTSAQVVNDQEKKDGFIPLFNGKDFEGWNATENVLKGWRVEDGMMKLNGRGASIYTIKNDYTDFIVRFEWKPHKKGYNSGFFIRGNNQIQMMQRDAGQLFANTKVGKGVPELHKEPGEFNEWEVTCIGSKVTLKVNGKLAWEVDDFKPAKGTLGIESEGSAIDFRNLRIKLLEPKKE